jgi:hypothetical protein
MSRSKKRGGRHNVTLQAGEKKNMQTSTDWRIGFAVLNWEGPECPGILSHLVAQTGRLLPRLSPLACVAIRCPAQLVSMAIQSIRRSIAPYFELTGLLRSWTEFTRSAEDADHHLSWSKSRSPGNPTRADKESETYAATSKKCLCTK